MGRQRVDGNVIFVLKPLQIKPADQKRLVVNDFRGLVFHHFIVQLFQIVHFRQVIIAGGDVRRGNADSGGRIGHAHQEIVFGFLQGLHVQIGAGRHHTDHFPLDQSLRLSGIFHLFPDGNLISFVDQLGQVAFHRVIRDAAHGRSFLQPAGFSCQRQLQLLRRHNGVLKKHFIEIPQPVKEDTVRILFFCLHVLLHHGRQIIHGNCFRHWFVLLFCKYARPQGAVYDSPYIK